ncbi:hypothetical protein U1Q18_002452, partial [Sarracenia purpurea var. burkii]
MAAKRSSLSISSHFSLPLNRRTPRRSQRTSLNLAFFNEPPRPRLVSVRAQNFGSDAGNFSAVSSVDGLESGSGPKTATHSDGAEASSSSSAIDFLTLCHRLK